MLSEHERIAGLRDRFASQTAFVSIGIGDDAALLQQQDQLLLSVDASVEGTHFRRDFASLEALAARAVVASLSDIFAMGGRPTCLLSSLSIPKDIRDSEFDAIIEGIRQASDAYQTVVIGGNLSSSSQLAFHTTAMGVPNPNTVSRSGAKAGDAIWVSGFPGRAALGLHELLRDTAGTFAEFWLRPTLNPRLAEQVSSQASACIDVSDGLLQDLGHICIASKVSAQLNLASVPSYAGFAGQCEAKGISSKELMLTGGEGYELLFTAPPRAEFSEATRIGIIIEQGPSRISDRDGQTSTHSKNFVREFFDFLIFH